MSAYALLKLHGYASPNRVCFSSPVFACTHSEHTLALNGQKRDVHAATLLNISKFPCFGPTHIEQLITSLITPQQAYLQTECPGTCSFIHAQRRKWYHFRPRYHFRPFSCQSFPLTSSLSWTGLRGQLNFPAAGTLSHQTQHPLGLSSSPLSPLLSITSSFSFRVDN